jgi:hypothetical protein
VSEQDKAKNLTEDQLKEATGMSDFDKAIMSGNFTAINGEIEAEAKKQGIDLSKPRDEKGRFVKAEAQAEDKNTDTTADPEEPVVYKMTVEVAPGHSIVVEADSQEACKLKADLAQKVAEAALAAAQPKEAPKLEEKKAALSEDELFEIGSKLQSGKAEAIDEYLEKNPAVLDRILEKQGVKLADLKEMIQERVTNREAQSWESAGKQFMKDHPDYVQSDLTRDLMALEVSKLGLADKPSADTLQRAYTGLKTKYPEVFTQAAPKTEEKKADPAPAPVIKKKPESSALFGLGGGGDTRPSKVDVSKVKVNLTPEQFNSMNPEQLAAWYNGQMEEITGQKRPF